MKLKFALYGFGVLGKKVFNFLSSYKKESIVIIENDSRVQDGVDIQSLDSACLSEDFVIVICVWNEKIDLAELYHDIRLHFPNNHIIFASELTNHFSFDHFWFISRNNLNVNSSKINQAKNLFRDARSRSLFDFLLNLRTTNDFTIQTVIDGNQYFPNDILEFSAQVHEEVFCDLGAFIGDTLNEIKCRGGVKYYCGFEPDKQNYSLLKASTENIDFDFEIFNLGSYSRSGEIGFHSNLKESSCIDLYCTDYTIQVVKLDEFNFKYMPTVFKMDIEGAEFDTLIGMSQIIKKYKPKLMICLYHKKDDFWRIPLYIRNLRGDYKMSLRQHAMNGLETVLYCY